MRTRCPECGTRFEVTPAQLGQANGRVRCGRCDTVFDALTTLEVEDAPGEPEGTAPRPPPAAAVLEAELAAEGPPRRRAGWVVVAILLAAALAGQLLWAGIRHPDRFPALSPLVARLCARLGCRIRPVRDPGRIAILARDVRRHPDDPRALRARALLVNRAPYPQPLPALTLRFTDTGGATVALRRFRPEEYLPAGGDPRAPLAPGQSVEAVLDILDPGPEAAGFAFEPG